MKWSQGRVSWWYRVFNDTANSTLFQGMTLFKEWKYLRACCPRQRMGSKSNHRLKMPMKYTLQINVADLGVGPEVTCFSLLLIHGWDHSTGKVFWKICIEIHKSGLGSKISKNHGGLGDPGALSTEFSETLSTARDRILPAFKIWQVLKRRIIIRSIDWSTVFSDTYYIIML